MNANNLQKKDYCGVVQFICENKKWKAVFKKNHITLKEEENVTHRKFGILRYKGYSGSYVRETLFSVIMDVLVRVFATWVTSLFVKNTYIFALGNGEKLVVKCSDFSKLCEGEIFCFDEERAKILIKGAISYLDEL